MSRLIYARQALVLLLLLASLWATVELALLARQTRRHTDQILHHASDVTRSLQAELTPAEIRNIKNTINTTAYTSQQVANDYGMVARATVRLLDGVTVDARRVTRRAETLLARVEEQTLPRVEVAVDRVSGQLVVLLDTADSTTRILQDRLADPAISRLIAETTETVIQSRSVAVEAEGSLRDIRIAISELVSRLNMLSDQTTATTHELEVFFRAVNKPVSRKQRLWRAIIQAVVYGLPIYLRTK